MKKTNLVLRGALHAIGVVLYVAIVALLMFKGGNIFGKDPNFLASLALLLLFVVSVAVMGILVFGKSILLYLDGKKKDALKLLTYILLWISLAFLVVLLISVLI